ncbi:hypothetical protein E1B28_005434 [Marasmius oreades]|uniref:Uncharacterized protein n=1 Tax=Marasmius oreades TaxID=181124 RepID=A0A9P7UUT6_9AGAR|nr:uncharacterized protein E1B28_005434 [Marasmius oreades]KAG7094610.1 hypothetical protein E1B28_005434 [Marasmius oreades]
MSSRRLKAAATRGKNRAREEQEQLALQRQVAASGGRTAKRKAGEQASVIKKKKQDAPPSQATAVIARSSSRRVQCQDSSFEEEDGCGSSSDSGDNLAGTNNEEELEEEMEAERHDSDNNGLATIASVDRNALLASEAPIIHTRLQRLEAVALFDDDDNVVEATSSRTSTHHRSSSAQSSSNARFINPPASAIDDYDMQNRDQSHSEEVSDPEDQATAFRNTRTEDSPQGSRPYRPLKQRNVRTIRSHDDLNVDPPSTLSKAPANQRISKPKKSVRQENFEKEVPVIQHTSAQARVLKNNSEKGTSRKPISDIALEREWPSCATLVDHPTGKSVIRITDQPHEIQRVIQHTLKIATIELVYINAYPDPANLTQNTRKLLLTSARGLNCDYPRQGYKTIKERIKSPDHEFTDTMGKVLIT